MEMTNGEIVTSYRQAKHKTQQIGILAELNRCSNKKIMEILIKGGIAPRSFSKNKAIFVDDADEAEVIEAPAVQGTIQPEEQPTQDQGIYELFVPLFNKVAELRAKRERIDNELGALNMYLNRLEDEIAGRSDTNE